MHYGFLYPEGGCSLLSKEIVEMPPTLKPEWYRDHPEGWVPYYVGNLPARDTKEEASADVARYALCLQEGGLIVADFDVEQGVEMERWFGWIAFWGPPGLEDTGFTFIPVEEEPIPPYMPEPPPPEIPEFEEPEPEAPVEKRSWALPALLGAALAGGVITVAALARR